MLDFLRKHAMAIALLVVAFGGWHFGEQAERQKWTEKVNNEYITQVEANRITQEKLNEISKDYQQELKDSEQAASDIVSSLESTGRVLRVKLKETGSKLGDCRRESDGYAELHRETSEALIRITTDADNHVKALQNTIRVIQGGTP